jgi:hypothetical protein
MLIIPEGVSFRFNSTLSDDGTGIDLTGVDTVVINLKPPGSAAVIPLTATIDQVSPAIIHADATPLQLTGVGDWHAWAKATYLDGRVVKTYGLAFRIVAEGTTVAGSC